MNTIHCYTFQRSNSKTRTRLTTETKTNPTLFLCIQPINPPGPLSCSHHTHHGDQSSCDNVATTRRYLTTYQRCRDVTTVPAAPAVPHTPTHLLQIRSQAVTGLTERRKVVVTDLHHRNCFILVCMMYEKCTKLLISLGQCYTYNVTLLAFASASCPIQLWTHEPHFGKFHPKLPLFWPPFWFV